MRVTFWGTRGSLAAPGADTARYGGNTSCVSVTAADGTIVVLDAGTGIRRLGRELPRDLARIDILLSHLHMDHIQGLGFFAPLLRPDIDAHIWGPPSLTLDLGAHLGRYLSPPLYPVHLREFACRLTLHEVTGGAFAIGPITVHADLVCHPGPTLGFRLEADGGSVAFLPDHELGIGAIDLEGDPRWISGYDLAAGVDLLIHDAQFAAEDYGGHRGWGHSAPRDVVRLAVSAGARQVALFHHSPDHDDAAVDRLVARAAALAPPTLRVMGAAEGVTIELPAPA